MSSSFNTGDILFQLFSFIVLAVFITGIIAFIRSRKRRNEQLERMEKKINELSEELRKK
ncbi:MULTISPECIES: DUF4083 domain-containing protein [Bacillaceae]|uniref:DUF4083 domain-containing protein n=1 Tax=Bacillaceae TaxID=186817 RepID=UPI000A3FE970|nr:DUF4083 domain-containing protein [Bacillus sp. FJAT-27916]